MERNTIYISCYNEVFIKTESPLFDRNRTLWRCWYFVSKNIIIEAGFMAQTRVDTDRNEFQIVIFNNLPFKE